MSAQHTPGRRFKVTSIALLVTALQLAGCDRLTSALHTPQAGDVYAVHNDPWCTADRYVVVASGGDFVKLRSLKTGFEFIRAMENFSRIYPQVYELDRYNCAKATGSAS